MAVQNQLSKTMLYFAVAASLGLNALQAPGSIKLINGGDTLNATQMLNNFTSRLDSTNIKVTQEYIIAPQFDSLVMTARYDSNGVFIDSQLSMRTIRNRRIGERQSKANTPYIIQTGDTLIQFLFRKLGPSMEPISAHIKIPVPGQLVASYLETAEK